MIRCNQNWHTGNHFEGSKNHVYCPNTHFYIDIDNLCGLKKNSKNSLPDNYFKNEITSKHWLLPRFHHHY
jgi:hypothetical protein